MQNRQELSEKSTKGYLFEIRDYEKNVLGYLYGTIHQLKVKDIFQLDPYILECFDRSSHLCLEVDIFPDWNETIAEFIKEQPVAMEHLFYSRAKSQGKEVMGLETVNSRQEATNVITKNYKDIYSIQEKAETCLRFSFAMMCKKYSELSNSLDSIETAGALLTVLEKLPGLIEITIEIIKNQKYLKMLEEKYRDDYMTKLETIVDNISQLLATGQAGASVNSLKHALIAQIAHDKDAEQQSLERMQKRFIEGNADFKITDLNTAPNSLMDKMVEEEQVKITIEHTQIRDRDMLESLDKDLRKTQSSLSKRCGFYAVGAFHLIGNYAPNLITLLQQKGWDVSPVNLNLTCLDKQRFFAKHSDDTNQGNQQYKPENSIKIVQNFPNK